MRGGVTVLTPSVPGGTLVGLDHVWFFFFFFFLRLARAVPEPPYGCHSERQTRGRTTIAASDTKSRNAAFLPACAVRSSSFRVLTLRSRTDRQRVCPFSQWPLGLLLSG